TRVRLAQANDVPHVDLDKLRRAHSLWTDAVQCGAVALGARAVLMAARRRVASARAAVCQSEPELAYRIERLALTSTPPPSASTPDRTECSRPPARAPTPGNKMGARGAICRTAATSAG